MRGPVDPVFVARAARLVLRGGLVALLAMWGALKFTAFEAEAIRPLVEHSPFLRWLYPVLGIRATSDLIGVIELAAALLIALRRWAPRVSAVGSLIAVATFLMTLSFLLTTPGVIAPDSMLGGFLVKDVVLLGAALFTAAESLEAAARKR